MTQHALCVQPGVLDALRFQEGRGLFQYIDQLPGSAFGYDGLVSGDYSAYTGPALSIVI